MGAKFDAEVAGVMRMEVLNRRYINYNIIITIIIIIKTSDA